MNLKQKIDAARTSMNKAKANFNRQKQREQLAQNIKGINVRVSSSFWHQVEQDYAIELSYLLNLQLRRNENKKNKRAQARSAQSVANRTFNRI